MNDTQRETNNDDPFMPPINEWIKAGIVAQWHCVNADGWASWCDSAPTPTGDSWVIETGSKDFTYTQYDLNGLDWRNSLRHRPE